MLKVNSMREYVRPRGRERGHRQVMGVKIRQVLANYKEDEMELCICEQLLGELLAYGKASFVRHWDDGSMETTYVVDR